MSIENSLTPAGVEPANFRFVAQHINHCDTAVPHFYQRCYPEGTRINSRNMLVKILNSTMNRLKVHLLVVNTLYKCLSIIFLTASVV